MILESMLENTEFDVYTEDFGTDAAFEFGATCEAAYGEMMLEIAKQEFAQYVNEGTITGISEGVMDTIKGWIEKIWKAIVKYYEKFKNWILTKIGNDQRWFGANEEKIRKGAASGKAKVKYNKNLSYEYISGSLTHFAGKIDSAADEAISDAKEVNDASVKTRMREMIGLKTDEDSLAQQFEDRVLRGNKKDGPIAKEEEVTITLDILQFAITNGFDVNPCKNTIASNLNKLQGIKEKCERGLGATVKGEQDSGKDNTRRAIESVMHYVQTISNKAVSLQGRVQKQAVKIAKACLAKSSVDESANIIDADAYFESLGI